MKDMLAEIAHRPFPMPESNSWIYYQEWNHVVFYKVVAWKKEKILF